MDLSKITPISTEPFVFGPLQTKWLEALESGEYKQTQRLLMREHKPLGGEAYKAFCCLGVLCDVADIPFVPETTDKPDYGYQWGDSMTNGYLPVGFDESVGLRTTKGGFKKGVSLSGLSADNGFSDTFHSLAEFNDGGALSFADIAAYIRHDPHNVFTESK